MINWLLRKLFPNPCKRCGFTQAAHYKPDCEFDIDNYPCDDYIEI